MAREKSERTFELPSSCGSPEELERRIDERVRSKGADGTYQRALEGYLQARVDFGRGGRQAAPTQGGLVLRGLAALGQRVVRRAFRHVVRPAFAGPGALRAAAEDVLKTLADQIDIAVCERTAGMERIKRHGRH